MLNRNLPQVTQVSPEPVAIVDRSNTLADPWLRLARLGWILLAMLAIGILLTSLPGYLIRINSGLPGHGLSTDPSSSYVYIHIINTLTSLASAILSLSLALLLFRHRFENLAVAATSFYLLLYAIILTGPLEFWGLYWLGSDVFAITAQTILLAAPNVAVLVLFPDGRIIPGWARWILVASLVWSLFAVLVPAFPYRDDQLLNLLVLAFSLVAIFGLGIYAQVYRYRRVSTPDERQQAKWVLFGFALWVGYLLISTFPFLYITSLPPGSALPWWSPLSELGWWLSLSILPVTLAIAITRSRLWNIDILINRTLVYGALTFATMALYVVMVGVLGNLLRLGNSNSIAFLTTGLVAILFQPLRERLQAWVNRLMYGERDDPASVLTKLGKHLEHTGSPQDALASITETVAHTLKLPYVAIEVGKINEVVASFGIPKTGVVRFPMSYQTDTSGHLAVAQRSPGESFSVQDIRLLENIARQAGAVAHAARLTSDLRLSYQKLVTAREEERRRIRRDLHDGLGPNLASLTLKVDAARNIIRTDPAKAEQMLDDLKKQIQGTIQDIRSLVYALRPPALDEFGLLGTLRSLIDKQTAPRPKINFSAPDFLPQLPAALEVAVYRIVQEGLSNVLKHSNADEANVRILLEEDKLVVEIDDDGVGSDERSSAGVGMTSMRERAEELGGSFQIMTRRKGFHIRATLPFAKE